MTHYIRTASLKEVIRKEVNINELTITKNSQFIANIAVKCKILT